MTTDELLHELAERGLRVAFRGDGTPYLRGSPSAASPALLRVLRHHREEIVRRLAPPPAREWLWRTGYIEPERPGDATWGNESAHKQTAFWWRRRGDRAWLPVPGTNPLGLAIPEGQEVACG